MTDLRPLTSFRFLAAMAVVFGHLGYDETISGIGVEFFFLLSGFILAYNYAGRFSTLSIASVARFWGLRAGRIFPLHWATFLLVLPLVLALPHPYTWTDATANVFLLQAWYPNGDKLFSFNSVSWSLSCELFFYLSLPAWLCFLNRSGIAARVLWLVALALLLWGSTWLVAVSLGHELARPGVDWWAGLTSPYVRVLDFFLGATVALLFGHFPRLRLAYGWNTALEVLSLLVFLLVWLLHGTVFQAYLWNYSAYFNLPLVAVLWVFAYQGGAISKLLSSRGLLHLGEISFALYMVHQVGIRYVNHFFGHINVGAGPLNNGWVHILFVFVILGVSHALYRLVEIPGRNAVRQRLNRRPVEPQQLFPGAEAGDRAAPAAAAGVGSPLRGPVQR